MQKLVWAGIIFWLSGAMAHIRNVNFYKESFGLEKNSKSSKRVHERDKKSSVTETAGPGQQGTASKNVHIVDTAFFMPQLNRHRRVWIYLPDGYETSKKKYPVLYLQDGQNVFDAATSFAGEWNVDETLDTLGTSYKQMIVVAVDNGGAKRLNEYSPYDTTLTDKKDTLPVKGEGDLYADFMVTTLKPFIDKQYRTKRNCKNTYVGGSSMGALISFYMLLKYPGVFGGGAIFSPAFWIAPQLKNLIAKQGKKVKGRLYFYAGKLESEQMVTDMLAVFEALNKVSKAKMTSVIRAGGSHNEAAWREEFPEFYKWLVK